MQGKTIIVTGASEGIGQELALQLAQVGANVVIAARSEEKLQAVRAACEAAGGQALAVATDVSQAGDCERLIQRTIEHFGRLDGLVNNAGISMTARFDEVTDLALFERLMAVNYLGAVYCTHHALPHLKATRGLLVAVSSWQGKTGFPLSTGYAASKHAMQGFFDSLRIELRQAGVAVLIVSPGPVATDIHTRKLTGSGAVSDRAAHDPHGLMPAEECARQIVHAMRQRQREVVMTLPGKLIVWLRLLAPALLDRVIAREVHRFYK